MELQKEKKEIWPSRHVLNMCEKLRKVIVFSSKTQDSRTQWLSYSACMNKAFFSFEIGINCNEKFGTK